jgi:hypothetical protein
MVNFRKLADRAKKAVDAAGGPDAVKDKAAGLKTVAKSKGSLSDKAKRAAEVVREDDSTAKAPASSAGAAAETPAQREQRRHRGGRRDEV